MNWINLPNDRKLQVLEDINKSTSFQLFIIEKDWWVVQTLRLISQMDVIENLVFKGGTSLSKAWRVINRFSEDVDLAINREFFGFSGDLSNSQITKLRKASSQYLANDFRSALQKTFDDAGIAGVKFSVIGREDVSDEDPVKIEVVYPAVAEYPAYVKPSVLLEIGSRSLMEPSTVCSFRSLIGEHFPEQPFADENVNIQCVNPERTFLEKLFLLHEEHQRPVEKMLIDGRSRHFYDICQINKTPFAEKAIADKELYKSIVAHRERFSKMKGVDYTSHFPPNLNPIPSAELMPRWKQDYIEMRGNMIVGDAPGFEELIDEIKLICRRINE
ncbi:MAG: nucleotidyl transferase AbiEii/AbiGii toxin family protein [Lentimicrobiaceae bacterium]|nr:nucleotidyl transferase AbiEii/AbiGii toxin family protein [Lentimicrobiaceae bacterium]